MQTLLLQRSAASSTQSVHQPASSVLSWGRTLRRDWFSCTRASPSRVEIRAETGAVLPPTGRPFFSMRSLPRLLWPEFWWSPMWPPAQTPRPYLRHWGKGKIKPQWPATSLLLTMWIPGKAAPSASSFSAEGLAAQCRYEVFDRQCFRQCLRGSSNISWGSHSLRHFLRRVEFLTWQRLTFGEWKTSRWPVLDWPAPTRSRVIRSEPGRLIRIFSACGKMRTPDLPVLGQARSEYRKPYATVRGFCRTVTQGGVWSGAYGDTACSPRYEAQGGNSNWGRPIPPVRAFAT